MRNPINMAMEPISDQLVTDVCNALVEAEMKDTLAALQHRVFNRGKAVEATVVKGGKVICSLKPFAELALREILELAPLAMSTEAKEKRAQTVLREAGY